MTKTFYTWEDERFLYAGFFYKGQPWGMKAPKPAVKGAIEERQQIETDLYRAIRSTIYALNTYGREILTEDLKEIDHDKLRAMPMDRERATEEMRKYERLVADERTVKRLLNKPL